MGKRKNGEGTVRYRNSDGRWEGRVFVGYDSKGNPKTRSVTAKTKSECLDKLEKLKHKFSKTLTTYYNYAQKLIHNADKLFTKMTQCLSSGDCVRNHRLSYVWIS